MTLASPTTVAGAMRLLEATDDAGRLERLSSGDAVGLEISQGQLRGSDAEELPKDVEARYRLLTQAKARKLARLRFNATVTNDLPNRNHVRFAMEDEEFEEFAQSFVGKPFLRDHGAQSIENRGGTIVKSWAEKAANGSRIVRQTVEVVKDWAIESVLDGTIDRFSVGWHAKKMVCSICDQDVSGAMSFFGFMHDHIPGKRYDDKGEPDSSGELCEIEMSGCTGVETSAVLMPACDGTEVAAVRLSATGATLIPLTAGPEESRMPNTPAPAAPNPNPEPAAAPAAAAPVAPAAEPASPEPAAIVAALGPKIREYLGLPETASDEDVEKELDKRLEDESDDEASRVAPASMLRVLELPAETTVLEATAALMGRLEPREDQRNARLAAENTFMRAAERVNFWAERGKFDPKESEIKVGAPPEQQGYAMRQALADLPAFEVWAREKAPVVPLNQRPPAQTGTGAGVQISGEGGSDVLTEDEERAIRATGVPKEKYLEERARIREQRDKRARLRGMRVV